jgi:hypothetical protein
MSGFSNTNMVSVSYAGGQGKTTFAQVLDVVTRRLGRPHKLVAADYQDENGSSKLGKMYPGEVEEFGIGAALTAARTENNPNAHLKYWDKLGHIFLSGRHILDIGANVFPNLEAWARDRDVAALLEKRNAPLVDFFCVAKAEKNSLDNTKRLIESMRKNKLFPTHRIFFVGNEAAGELDHAVIYDFAAMEDVTYICMPQCYSEIWRGLEAHSISLLKALSMDEIELATALDIDIFSAAAGTSELKVWIEKMTNELADKAGIESDAA